MGQHQAVVVVQPLGPPRRGPAGPVSAALTLGLCLAAVQPAWAQIQPEQAPAETPAPSLFKRLGHDVKGLASKESVTWLGAGLATMLAAMTADDYLAENFSDAHGVEETFEPGEVLGSVAVQAGGAAVVYGLGTALHRPAMTAAGADLVRAQILTQAITQAVKFTVDRTRPDGTARSFPSGHASTTFATVTVLQRHFGWKVGGPGYAAAAFVAASRVQSRKHYLSDVVFGATIGVVVGRDVSIGRGRSKFAPVPVFTRGGAGISFVRVNGRR